MNDLDGLAFAALSAGFVVAFLLLFSGALLLGFVQWMKDTLG
jgi:p-aminobenzoyl-glutamate transporter AbgT